ncbi:MULTISPECIES: GNAT family N-acetyltransferase [Dyadobacter]|jgi:GNAT superfamily N-acetyltransferase|uniref:N-acetylglutamate synthase-like GNAT family acetyltransferase n=2 Tax=Dyadobacter TaxID=120831 RepID=A0A2P8FWL3_9BACT|nr:MULTISPECIES: GNAT family N-acetyltransferase [Dyadobacter]MBO9612058.1 GNAT family N-acetyltransferase [Dyadobacter sp.]MDR6807255.1 GNAT superfamily N-acetyltransferase [Dyadobacter fermentans]MDR7044996.1 GNAT superfamily N-acetyltransferase [Dyadobacter sp. BE242]MDR7199267.1 GNAT superfamily N-acetyltransferase [Dyadobacter sp. BE34]MDR7217227.1 GNAT superfamily N-acetyltransferase [Dyadobacter sp. BE31]
MNISTRQGTAEDIPAIFELVKELAIYERALNQVTNNVDKMTRDYNEKLFDFFVAEVDSKIIGLCLYYYRYSTWKGKRLYMEDIIVTESMRGNGIGKILFDATVVAAKNVGCTGMMWQVLDWNTSAVNFYRKYGTNFDNEWINCNLDF